MTPSFERVLRRDHRKKCSRPYLLYAVGLLAVLVLLSAVTDTLKARAQSVLSADEARITEVVKACEAKVRELTRGRVQGGCVVNEVGLPSTGTTTMSLDCNDYEEAIPS